MPIIETNIKRNKEMKIYSYKTLGLLVLIALFANACAARTKNGKNLAYRAEEIQSDEILDYSISVREPKEFNIGYRAKMMVHEFAKGDTFNLDYKAELYIPKAANGMVNITADYRAKIYWCEGSLKEDTH